MFGNRNGMSAAYRQLHIVDRLQHGALIPEPNIARLDGVEVEFADGLRGERFVASNRHTTRVCFDDDLLGLERRAGADRARVAGYVPAIAARA